MVDAQNGSNHYQTLKVNRNASQAEIKQSYRRLVKLFHPDSNPEAADKDEIIRINAAYEVLGDKQKRLNYDQGLREDGQRANKSHQSQSCYPRGEKHHHRQTGKDADKQVEEWLHLVYQPVNSLLAEILGSLKEQIECLAADPFDDDLLEAFLQYLDRCRNYLKKGELVFRSLPNPPSLAKTAAYLYHIIGQVNDGIEQLAYFPLCYDERYLHTGQELFRIATRLHREMQESVS